MPPSCASAIACWNTTLPASSVPVFWKTTCGPTVTWVAMSLVTTPYVAMPSVTPVCCRLPVWAPIRLMVPLLSNVPPFSVSVPAPTAMMPALLKLPEVIATVAPTTSVQDSRL